MFAVLPAVPGAGALRHSRKHALAAKGELFP